MAIDYSQEQKKTIELVKGDLDSTAKVRADLVRTIKKRRQMYDSELPNRQYNGRANVRVPFPYTWAQSMVPLYIHSIFGGKTVVDAYPRFATSYEKARNTKLLLNFQLLYEMEFFQEAVSYFTAQCSDGIAIQKVKWDQDRQTGELHLISARDFACDPRSAFLGKKTQWVAHIIGKTKEELLEGVQTLGYNPDVVAKIIKRDANQTMNDGTVLSKMRAVYNIWEWWGKADIGPDPIDPNGAPGRTGIRPVICHYFEEDLLSARTSPYGDLIPFVATTDVPDPYNIYKSKSELDPMESMYEAASDILNQRLDNVSLGINGLWTYLTGSGIDLKRLVSAPWGIVGVKSHDDLKRWDSQNVTQNAYQEIPAMLDLMKLSSGLQDVQRGMGTKGVDTFSGLSLVNENASQRPGMKVKLAQFLYVQRIAEMLLQEDKMFMTQQKAIRDIGDPQAAAQVFEPADLAGGDWDVCPSAIGITGDKNQRAGILINFLNVLRGMPGQEQSMNDIVEEAKSLIDIQHHPMSDGVALAQKQAALQSFNEAMQAGPKATPGVANNPGQPTVGVSRQPISAPQGG